MLSRKKSEKVQKLGDFLRAPFHYHKSRSSSPIPTSNLRPAFNGSSCTLVGTAYTDRDGSQNPKSLTVSEPVEDEGFLGAPFYRGNSGSLNPTSTPRPASSNSSSTLVCPIYPTRDQDPNPQLLTVSSPVNNVAFQKAIRDYVESLSDDDQVAFQSATDVMEKIQMLHYGSSCQSSSRIQKVKRVLECMKLFLKPIAIYSQKAPDISSFVVGGFNCILTVSTSTPFIY